MIKILMVIKNGSRLSWSSRNDQGSYGHSGMIKNLMVIQEWLRILWSSMNGQDSYGYQGMGEIPMALKEWRASRKREQLTLVVLNGRTSLMLVVSMSGLEFSSRQLRGNAFSILVLEKFFKSRHYLSFYLKPGHLLLSTRYSSRVGGSSQRRRGCIIKNKMEGTCPHGI
ncbi:hypothetical protein CDAR_580511 [Caerostris darwini]|uniref:Uncharacterized protein n=1 Tax=Caerostris darwini TaxID=1538125 RepID=A0AAV4R409_9ARAC|nr:hypothetical protein CDAR_580511 [Caerostris darwini]